MTAWIVIASTAAALSTGAGLMIRIGARRILRKVDQPPHNTPAEFLKDSGSSRKGLPVVVCAGDSITHGSISANYVEALAARFAGAYEFVNAGVNGELAYNLGQRIQEISMCDPEVVTVLIGTNDVNALTNRTNMRRYIKDMNLPQPPDEAWYRENLTAIVRSLRKHTRARIALLSLPPVGEDPTHPAYARSEAYGRIAEAVARESEVDILPLGERMREYLAMHPGTPRGRATHARRAVMALVVRRFVLKQSYEQISAASGQTLLTDHLHLNDTAAAIVTDLVAEYL